MAQEIILSAIDFINAYNAFLLPVSLGVLGITILILWFRIYRLHSQMGALAAGCGPSGETKKNDADSLYELKRASELLFAELQKQIDEEKNRITVVQRMLIETREKLSAENRRQEKTLQDMSERLEGRMDMLERRFAGGRGRGENEKTIVTNSAEENILV